LNARERHRRKLLDYLGNPENDFPARQAYAKEILGIAVGTMYRHFSPDDMQDIENEAYSIRKQRSSKQRSILLKTLFDEARSGNVQAIKEFFDRTEGKAPDTLHINPSSIPDQIDIDSDKAAEVYKNVLG
jgi:hypothetical protein